MPLMRTATMKSRQAEAALADAGAPGGRSGEEYLMWCAALRQERADKHTALMTPGVEQHRAVVRVGAAWVRVLAGGQSMQASLPISTTYLPAGQSMQSPASSLPEAWTYVPAAQSMQSPAASLPEASTYVPAAQSMQASLPISTAHLPAGQSMQSPASSLTEEYGEQEQKAVPTKESPVSSPTRSCYRHLFLQQRVNRGAAPVAPTGSAGRRRLTRADRLECLYHTRCLVDPAPEPTQTLAVLTGCAVCVSGPCRKMDLMVTQRQLGLMARGS